MRKVILPLSFLLFFAVAAGGAALFVYEDFRSSPAQGVTEPRLKVPRIADADLREQFVVDGYRFVEITKGATFKSVAAQLAVDGLIANELIFKIFAKIEEPQKLKSGSIKAGTFAFHASMKPADVLKTLYGEPVQFVRNVTVPEGFNLHEIAWRFEEKKIVSASEFLAAATDPKFFLELGLPKEALDSFRAARVPPRIEGYLYPARYTFPLGADAKTIMKTMVKQFLNAKRRLELEEKGAEHALDLHKVVTLASIIEKETGRAEERPLISSVFHNRLRAKPAWFLQTDPTTCYAINEVEGWKKSKCNITLANIRIAHPYNTYHVKGLPPGPIASPGEDALRAAIKPERTEFFFFVSKNDGSHVFTRTYGEHTKNVDYFQKTLGGKAAPKRGAGSSVAATPETPQDVERKKMRGRSRDHGLRPPKPGEVKDDDVEGRDVPN
ncbi:MAG: endolytic transglycosylase MltG [Deltaproteobacteria bacterium]|nr:endolytic transglycosylase MltG [Deltaproteobacteria bacterium]